MGSRGYHKNYQNLLKKSKNSKKIKFGNLYSEFEIYDSENIFMCQSKNIKYPNFPKYWSKLNSWDEIYKFEKFCNFKILKSKRQKVLKSLVAEQQKKCQIQLPSQNCKINFEFFDLSRENFDNETSLNLQNKKQKLSKNNQNLQNIPKFILKNRLEEFQCQEFSDKKFVKIPKNNYKNDEFSDKCYSAVDIREEVKYDDFGQSLFLSVNRNILMGKKFSNLKKI